MTIIQSIILGIVQGLTEFLPISSSAHLVLVPYLFNWSIPESQVFPFDVLVQLGTLAAVIIYFWNDLWSILRAFVKGIASRQPFASPESRMGYYLILATIPAGISGLLLKSRVEAAFNSPTTTALFLFVTAAFLLIAEWVGKRQRNLTQLNWVDALWIGLFQAVSIFPGISRSGSTMTGGMTRQLDRPSAARFSFLMSVPVMLGAGAVSVKDLLQVPNLSSFLPVMAIGFVTSGVVGFFSIRWLLGFIQKRSLISFAIYCAAVAALVLAFSAFRTPVAAQAPATQTPLTANTSASSQVLQVAYTPSMEALGSTLTSCANAQNGFSMVVRESPAASLLSTQADVMIRLGAPAALSLPSFTLGSEKLTFVVNSENPLHSLTLEQLSQIMSGRITRWDAFQQSCPECFSGDLPESLKGTPIALNFYSEAEDIQTALEARLAPGTLPARSQALLIPDPIAMIEAVSSSPSAIGFVPGRAFSNKVKDITISEADPQNFTLPILAITSTQPTDTTRAFLNCLQNSLLP
jgi:undecaprenyl-diphosphatase